jgi:hypothetical protein
MPATFWEPSYGSPEHFFETAKATLDRLRNDGDDAGRMMSIGLHPRITGNPAAPMRLARFIDYRSSLRTWRSASNRHCRVVLGASAERRRTGSVSATQPFLYDRSAHYAIDETRWRGDDGSPR